MDKAELPNGQELFRLIEVCRLANVQPGILRYWGTQFEQIKTRESDSGEYFYDRKQAEVVLEIRHLLMDEHLSIEVVRQRLMMTRWNEKIRKIGGNSAGHASNPPTTETDKPSGAEWQAQRHAKVDPEIRAEVNERLAPLLSMVHSMNARAAKTFGIHDTWH